MDQGEWSVIAQPGGDRGEQALVTEIAGMDGGDGVALPAQFLGREFERGRRRVGQHEVVREAERARASAADAARRARYQQLSPTTRHKPPRLARSGPR